MPSPSSEQVYDPTDLEVLTTLLDLAAIYLTPDPSATFTRDELIDKARELGGESISARDLAIVLPGMRSLKKLPGGRWRMA